MCVLPLVLFAESWGEEEGGPRMLKGQGQTVKIMFPKKKEIIIR